MLPMKRLHRKGLSNPKQIKGLLHQEAKRMPLNKEV